MAIYGIKAVKYCLSQNLLHYVEADEGGGQTRNVEVFNPATGQCTVTNPLTVLPCLVGSKATLTVDDAVVNRRHQYTARLTFVTADNPNLDGEYYAFVVETNEGEQLLLGSKVAPRCSVTTRQNVAATAGDINGYTTTVDFKAPYAPLRLPVTTEPVTDTREFDICCGSIAQPQQPDTREFDICCGQIAQPPVPDTREFDVCCGEIVGQEPEPELLTVMWLNYDLSVVDSKTYREGQPEPTTSVVPTRPATSTYTYTFSGWELYGQTATRKVYISQYTVTPISSNLNCDIVATGSVAEQNRYLLDTVYNGQHYSGDGVQPLAIIENNEAVYHGDAIAFKQTENFTLVSTDWHDYFTRFTDRTPIYDANNPSMIIGYKLNTYSGDLPPWS